MDISDISIRKMIAESVENHAYKAYEFSHFFPYSDPSQSLQPIKREGKFILPKPFAYDYVSCDETDSFELVLVDISDVSIGKMIAEGVEIMLLRHMISHIFLHT